MRLRNLGAFASLLKTDKTVRVIEQDQEERLRHRPQEDIRRQFLRGQLYQLAKEMFLKAQRTNVIDVNSRKRIMAQVNAQLDELYAGTKEFTLMITFPDKYQRGLLSDWEFSTAIIVKARHRGLTPTLAVKSAVTRPL
jgi:hypothetical protein